MVRVRPVPFTLMFLAACSGSTMTGGVVEPGTARRAESGAGTAGEPMPPVAVRRDRSVPSPNGSRDDPYYWLRDDTRKNREVLAYLEAENDYMRATLGRDARLEDTLFAEMRSRVKEDDSTVPVLEDGYWYYKRYETGKQQPIICRRKGEMSAPEEILLDGNKLAEGHAYYWIGSFQVTRDGKIIAWADDTVGRYQYSLHIKEIASGKIYPDTATNIWPSMVWANDNKTLFYTGKDPITLRMDRVFRHVIGATRDDLIYKEEDSSYYVSVAPTKSRRYIQLVASATTNTEVRLVDAGEPVSPPVVFLPRSEDHEYTIDHLDGRFLILTNADAKNFRLVSVREGRQADRTAWKDIIPHRADKLIEDFSVFHDFIAATVRTGGLRKVEVLPDEKPSFFLDAQEPTYAMTVIDIPDARSRRVRYSYSSMVQPTSTFEADIATRRVELLKRSPVPGYHPEQYTSEYLHAKASDGTQVPISVVYKKTTRRDGTAPLLVHGYGSYGISIDPQLNSPMISLLDRGWVYAIAHLRGGQEMGRSWYEDGKLMKKKNTFTDFIAATEHLIAGKFGARDQVYARGGSAGGLLMGAVLNMRPDLYRGAILLVPFVDVVTTMLDTSIPLTTNEFDEWGDPRNKAAYDYMLSYSPYDNIVAQDYPSIYVRTGLWDSQVQYYEPAKWVAKLRATRTDGNLLLLDTDMTSGHSGASGRFDRLKQVAREMAFLLHVHDRPDRREAWPAR